MPNTKSTHRSPSNAKAGKGSNRPGSAVPVSHTLPPAADLKSLFKMVHDQSGGGRLRASRRENPLIGACDLNDFPYLVLLGIKAQSPRASGISVLDFIVTLANAVPDEAQSYSTIKRLIALDFVAETGREKSRDGGPPIRLLGITPKGERALEQKEKRLKALMEVVEANTKRQLKLVKAINADVEKG